MTNNEARAAITLMILFAGLAVLLGALSQADKRNHEFRMAKLECSNDQ